MAAQQRVREKGRTKPGTSNGAVQRKEVAAVGKAVSAIKDHAKKQLEKADQDRTEESWGVILDRLRSVGRDRIPIPNRTIYALAKAGSSNTEMADALAVHANTLVAVFGDIITKGRADMKITLRRKQLSVAMEGNPTMLIWLGKQVLDQQESPSVVVNNNELRVMSGKSTDDLLAIVQAGQKVEADARLRISDIRQLRNSLVSGDDLEPIDAEYEEVTDNGTDD